MDFYNDFSADQHVSIDITGHQFDIPRFPDPTGIHGRVKDIGANLWRLVDEWSGSLKAVRTDQRFSDFGRAEKVLPIAETAHLRLLGSWNLLSNFEVEINAREKALIRIPEIDRSNSVALLEDREIRDWWDRQDVATRTKYMEQAGEPGSDAERMAIAILRSPIPQSDTEKTHFRKVWGDSRRMENPVEAEAIMLGRGAIDWAEKNIHYATVVTQQSFKSVPRDKILKFVNAQDKVLSAHVSRLGFSGNEVAQAQLRAQHQAAL